MIFEYRKTLRPSTYSYTIESMSRVRDPNNKNKEYYFCIMKATVLNLYGYIVSSTQFIYSNRFARSHSFLRVQSLILVFCIETDAHEAYLHKCPISLEY